MSYFKILFCGVSLLHLAIILALIGGFGVMSDQTNLFRYGVGFPMFFGLLSAVATIYEIILEEGLASGFLSFIALSFPIVGSYFLFSFLIKEIKKQNILNARNI